MVFSSIEFIYFFLPIFLLIYYVVPAKWKNACLFLGSMVFYTIGSIKTPLHACLFAGSLAVNYAIGRFIERYDSKPWFVIGLLLNIMYLAFFKYFWNSLPIGISFYTFQAISYLCDVRSKRNAAEKGFVDFGTYFSMFPYVTSGPIVRYGYIASQFQSRICTIGQFAQGLQTFILGLGSKVLLADRVGTLWAQLSVIGYESVSTPLAWLGLFAYTFQIYFDFWGYSLMAMGVGRMLGFALPINFDYPYLSTSMTEFWRRWHMTLGSWFKDYVYIPLGGNRAGKAKMLRNMLLVWLLTGVWHGAGVNFLLWGMLLFVLIAIEKAGLKQWLDKYKAAGHVYMAAAIPLTWAVFANADWNQLVIFFQKLFGINAVTGGVFSGDYIKYGKEYGAYLLLCFLFCTRLPQKVWGKFKNSYAEAVVLTGIFLGAVYCLYIGLDTPFLYNQF